MYTEGGERLRKDPTMDYYWKALREQMHILETCDVEGDEASLQFLRVHALTIVQLCDALISLSPDGCGAMASPRGQRRA